MDFQSTKAIYLQIADFVCEQILLKKWLKTEKIPSVRDLAVSLQVNPNTVVRTYAFLEEKSIIKMQRGIGYFVTEEAHKQIIELKKEEFLMVHLPQFFKSMDLLDIDLEQLKKLYEQRIKSYE
jgi:DNA-binding transcriptional regulator YhcF (GntR family)